MMKNIKNYLLLHYSSLLLLIVSLLFFALFLLSRWDRPVLGICAVVFALIFAVLHLLCRKPLHCEDGYSLPQAITYFIACKNAGCRMKTLQQDEQLLLQQAKKENLEDYGIEQLQNCFKIGAKAVREINNPLLQALWKTKQKPKK